MTQSSDVQGNINKIIIVKVKFILTFTIIKEALIKSGVHDAQSDFSSDCIKTTQAYCRMSRSFCAGWRKICKQNVRQVEDVI